MNGKKQQGFTGYRRNKTTRFSVRSADFFARKLISVGGIGTIVTVCTVCVFLVYVALPLFESPDVSDSQQTLMPTGGQASTIMADEYRTTGLNFRSEGELEVFRLDTGALVGKRDLANGKMLTSWSISVERDKLILGYTDGTIRLGKLEFTTDLMPDKDVPADARNIHEGEIAAGPGESLITNSPSGHRIHRVKITLEEPVKVSSKGAIIKVDQTIRSNDVIFVAMDATDRVFVKSVRKFENLMTGEVIDLSVGSLIAMSAMTTAYCVVQFAGAWSAGVWSIVICMFAGIAACGFVGLLNGLMVTRFAVPPFVVTLAMMLVARGLAFIIGQGQSIYQLPDSVVWLGQGADLFGIPNTVVLLVILYVAAHIMMSRTVLGRYIYAAGGNTEAARLSGVPVKRVILFCYVMCGALAGLGGVIRTSILKSGSPRYGEMSELFVIAAVVVGGTSLGGGKGKIFGTLIGVLIISVIQNGMNLTDVESYTQKVVLGLVILGAVLLDSLRGGRNLKGLARLMGLKGSQPKLS